jgi:acyl-CoA reductase-like NAD-dependent aldehyde dehydrogenase
LLASPSSTLFSLESCVSLLLFVLPPPPPLVVVLCSYGDTGAALVSGGVDKVLFIGSPAVGKKVMEAASKSRCLLCLFLCLCVFLFCV